MAAVPSNAKKPFPRGEAASALMAASQAREGPRLLEQTGRRLSGAETKSAISPLSRPTTSERSPMSSVSAETGDPPDGREKKLRRRSFGVDAEPADPAVREP